MSRSVSAAMALLGTLGWALPVLAQAKPTPPAAIATFVQGFYEWYLAAQEHGSTEQLLHRKELVATLSPELLRGLSDDFAAQASDTSGDIVGLDYDPFLAAQDPCDRYVVAGVTRVADRYRVAVRGVGGCEKDTRPDVYAEVVPRGTGWVVVNFRYPRDSSDLITELSRLKAERRRNRR